MKEFDFVSQHCCWTDWQQLDTHTHILTFALEIVTTFNSRKFSAFR